MDPVNLPDFNDTETAFSGRSNRELKHEYRLFRLMNNSGLTSFLTTCAQLALRFRLPVQWIIRRTIFEQFCGGESLQDTAEVVRRLGNFHIGAILDYGVEGKENDAEFDRTRDELIRATQFAGHYGNIPFISCKITGLARFTLLEKLHDGTALNEAETVEKEALYARVRSIAEAAATAGMSLFVDAEETWIQDGIDTMVQALMRDLNRERAVVHNTAQMYRHDRLDFIAKSFEDARERNYILGMKLVRGAYMQKERKRAAEMGYPSPIQPDKEATDRDFDKALSFCAGHVDTIAVTCASHNEKSNYFLASETVKRNIPRDHPHIIFSQLYGMSDQVTYNLAGAGFRATKYLPYGPVRDVVPYLIRRAQENSSVSGQMSRELALISREIKRRGI